MKKLGGILLAFVIGLFIMGAVRAGSEIRNNVILHNLTTDGEYNSLSIDGSGNVYIKENAGASAHLSGACTFITTGAGTYYPLPCAFQNDILEKFDLSGDMIVYHGPTMTFRISYVSSVDSSINATTTQFGIKINGTLSDHFPSECTTTSTVEFCPLVAIGGQILSSGDTIQLVGQSNQAGAVITIPYYSTTVNRYF